MDRSLVELESIVRNRICKVCTERTVDGAVGAQCACSGCFRRWPAIQSVTATISKFMLPCCSRMRRRPRDPDAAAVRSMLLLLVVDAIEEATGKTFNKQGLGPPDAGFMRRPGPQIQL